MSASENYLNYSIKIQDHFYTCCVKPNLKIVTLYIIYLEKITKKDIIFPKYYKTKVKRNIINIKYYLVIACSYFKV